MRYSLAWQNPVSYTHLDVYKRQGGYLVRWAMEQREAGICCVNMLGCHDGIPLLDLKGLVPDERIQNLIDLIVGRGGLIKNLHGQTNLYLSLIHI